MPLSRNGLGKAAYTNDFPALTGIRLVAATMVCLYHYAPFPVWLAGPAIPAIVAQFHVGVTIFFVLSGFLICHRYEEGFTSKSISFRDYFVRRFARIYPMYFLVTLFVFLPFICHCSFHLPLFLLNISFLQGLFFRIQIHWRRGGMEPDSRGNVLWSFSMDDPRCRKNPACFSASAAACYGIGPVANFQEHFFSRFFFFPALFV